MEDDAGAVADSGEGGGTGGARAILRVPEVLAELALRPDGAGLAELVAALAIPKASLHRLLRTLESAGYVVHGDGLFRLGPASFDLARLIAPAGPVRDLVAAARPELERLARDTGETIMLGVLSDDGDEIVYRDVIDSAAPVRFSIGVGTRRPLYSVAAGLAVLAQWPDARLADWLAHTRFTAFTPRTLRREALPARLAEVRARGVAFDDGGRAEGAGAVAAAVLAAGGEPACVLSIAGPLDRIVAHRARLDGLVLRAAERLSRLLGQNPA